MSKLSKIQGAGGGGGKGGGKSQRAPVEAPDSLLSLQLAKVQDLVCEGEIGGLVDGMKSVFFNDTPVQNPDGSFNFNNVQIDSVNGLQSQSYMAGFSGAEAETTVATEITNAASVSRTISDENITDVKVTLGFPQMTSQNTTTGDLNGTSVVIAIDIQNDGGGYVAQALRQVWSASNFLVSAGQAETNLDATNFQIVVGWLGSEVIVPQTCTFKLQYRAVGDTTWIDYTSHTFSGRATAITQNFIGIGGYLASNSVIGYVGTAQEGFTVNDFFNRKTYLAPSAIKTFDVQLASGQYEFRALKTTGSDASVGAAYGGAVSINSGQVYVPSYVDIISGKCTSRYKRTYKFPLPTGGPWDVRVRRITADNGSATLQNSTYFDSFTQVIDSKLTYPNSAIIGVKIDAKQFSSIPVRGYELDLIKVKIPSNYDPLTREYSGAWDGTFQTAVCSNPAWAFYDIITKNRYGLGRYVSASQVDKWALYTIAQYCDELVGDGFGGLEPRFTCNIYLQTREQAYKVIQNMASVFRAMAYWAHDSILATQDSPKSVSQLFTPANIVGGQFRYQGSSGRTRHNVVLVAWNDPSDMYRQKIEYVDDAESITRFGINQTEVVASGCTSRGQAHRFGLALIHTEKEETETVVFRAGMDVVLSSIGDVIETSDPIRSGVRFGGRVASATLNTVTLDSDFTLEDEVAYSISCVLPDGTIETKAIINSNQTTSQVQVDEDFSVTPMANSMWIIRSSVLIPEKWRIITMSEVNKTQMDITALSYREDKYGFIENELVLQPLPYSLIAAGQPSQPVDFKVTETLYLAGLNVVGTKAFLSWDVAIGAISYTVTYLKEDQTIVQIPNLETNSFEIIPIEEGNYTFNVYAVNSLGRRSQAATVVKTIEGKTTLPIAVENFTITKVSGLAQAAWSQHPDLDVQVGGYIVVRHTPLTTGATWQDGVIFDSFTGLSVNGTLPLVTGTYMAKAVDSGGRYSEDAVMFVATEGMVTGFTTVGTLTENPSFTGAKTDIIVESSAIKIDSALEGTYEFSSVLDLSTVATRRFEVDITAVSYDIGSLVDDILDNVDSWGSVDGNIVDDCDATIYASLTDDDPTGSPETATWSDWVPFFVSDFTCRAIKFKIVLESETLEHNILISELIVHAKEPA